jgi:hypothetical protein
LALSQLRRSLEPLAAELVAHHPAMAMNAPDTRTSNMRTTPFPASPGAVVALTVPEFTCELDLSRPESLDDVCRRFLDDANRALVWLIRFRALTTWCERTDVVVWLRSDHSHARHACAVAASFELNEEWGFDAERFRSAVESFR